MNTKPVIKKPVPLLCISILLSSLLASGCSNNNNSSDNSHNDSTESAAKTEPATTISAVTDTADTNLTTNNSHITDDKNHDDKVTHTDTLDNDAANPAAMSGDNRNPLLTQQPQSLVTNRTETGTPEDTVKQALNTLYYGDVKKAATYYKVDIANFEEELANTQYAFQQTVESVTIFDTKYNADKTRATISGELMLKGQSEPAPLGYELQKIKGEWKILG